MHKRKFLRAGCCSLILTLALSSCGTNRLKVSEVCFIRAVLPDVPACECYTVAKPDGEIFPLEHCDRYQAMSPENAGIVKEYVNKCLKAGIRP